LRRTRGLSSRTRPRARRSAARPYHPAHSLYLPRGRHPPMSVRSGLIAKTASYQARPHDLKAGRPSRPSRPAEPALALWPPALIPCWRGGPRCHSYRRCGPRRRGLFSAVAPGAKGQAGGDPAGQAAAPAPYGLMSRKFGFATLASCVPRARIERPCLPGVGRLVSLASADWSPWRQPDSRVSRSGPCLRSSATDVMPRNCIVDLNCQVSRSSTRSTPASPPAISPYR